MLFLATSELYVANMLKDSLLPRLEAELVFASQCFIRSEEEDCSVSLRDVRRFKKLVGWFFETWHHWRLCRLSQQLRAPPWCARCHKGCERLLGNWLSSEEIGRVPRWGGGEWCMATPRPAPFQHGHAYVLFSRVRNRHSIGAIVDDATCRWRGGRRHLVTTTIFYGELLHSSGGAYMHDL